jgi:hypothetical protein
LFISMQQTGFNRVRRKLLNAQFIDMDDNLVENRLAGFTVPVLQNFFDGEISVLVLRELDHRPAYFVEKTLTEFGQLSASDYFLDYAQAMLIDSKLV